MGGALPHSGDGRQMPRAMARWILLVTVSVVLMAPLKAFAGGTYEASHAHWLDEFRVGGLAHDLEDTEGEDGVDINLEALFAPVGTVTGNRILDIFLNPRPHIGAFINTAGDTSGVYFGLTWDVMLTDFLFIETTFGGAFHDGPTDDSHSSFGCTANFRESASLGLVFSEHWRLLATVSHMSNGGFCDENEGLTSAGARLGYRW